MDNENNRKFKPNSKYFTISIYVILTFLVCAIIARLIFNFSAIWGGLRNIISVMLPFAIGIILAYLINPMYKALDQKVFAQWLHMKNAVRARKVLSLLISYLVFLGIIVLIISFVIPQLVTSLESLVTTISGAIPGMHQWLTNLQSRFSELDLDFIGESIDTFIPSLSNYLREWATSLMSSAVTTSISVLSGAVKVLLAIFVSIYMLSDKVRLESLLRKLFYALFKRETAAKISKRCRESSTIFSNFFAGKAIDSLIVGVLCFVSMLIFRLPYALLISVVVAVTNMIPYFGPFIGAIPSILILLMIGWKEAVIFAIIILVIQQLDGNLIGPKIIGDSTGLRPIWVLFAITIGTWIGGVLGMLFAVPVMAVIAYLVEGAINERLQKKGLETMTTEQRTPVIWQVGSVFKRLKSKFKKNKDEE